MSSTAAPLNYDFLGPRRIVFGWGRWREVGPLAAEVGSRALVITGSRTLTALGLVSQLHDVLRQHRIETVELAQITREPEVDDVDEASERLRRFGVRAGDVLVALGGGAAIDLAKALAAMATNTAAPSVKDYLEGVGSGAKLVADPLPVIALPTTAGTGSEATKNAVISCQSPPVKRSLRADGMLPRVVIVDPQLTVSAPASTTAHSGMDAITQLVESYISRKKRPIPRALAIDGLRRALPAIVEAVENPQCQNAREGMAHAALLSGMALANSGLGMAHGVAAALGVHAGVPHGLACAAMLPVALRVNRDVARRDLAELAVAAGLASDVESSESAQSLIDRIEEIGRRIGIPQRLSALGVRREQIPDLVRDSRGNSMDGNPRTLSDPELTQILEAQL